LIESLFKALLGDMLTTEKVDNLEATFINSAFLGVRVCWQEEVPATRKGTEALKRLSGGCTINIRWKYKNGQHQENVQTLVFFDSNSPPALEQGPAMERRFRQIEMPYTFVSTPTRPKERKKDTQIEGLMLQELSGLLNMLIPYAKHYLDTGELKNDMLPNMQLYDKKTAPLDNFIMDMCEPTGTVTDTTFFTHFKKYCEALGNSTMQKSGVNHLLRTKHGFKFNGHTIVGLSIKTDVSMDMYDNGKVREELYSKQIT
jgi:phage/plasmid-associated DNA primase